MNSPVENVAEDVMVADDDVMIADDDLHETEQISSKPNEEEPNNTDVNSAIEDKEKEELVAYLKKEISMINDQDNAAETVVLKMQLAYDKITEFKKMDPELKELKDQVVRKCGKMDIEEKRRNLFYMKRLATPTDLIDVAYIIVGSKGLYYDTTKNGFAIDENAEDDFVFWELKFYMNDKKFVDDADRVNIDGMQLSDADSPTSHDFPKMDDHDIDAENGYAWKF